MRHTPAAIGVLVGGSTSRRRRWGERCPAIRPDLPIAIVADSLTTVHKPGYALAGRARVLLALAGYAALALSRVDGD